MPDPREIQALRAEVETLREEVARLRATQAAHVCAQPAMPLAHQPFQQAWANNAAAGGAVNYTMNTALTGNPAVISLPSGAFIGGCAGAGQNLSLWYTTAGGDCS